MNHSGTPKTCFTLRLECLRQILTYWNSCKSTLLRLILSVKGKRFRTRSILRLMLPSIDDISGKLVKVTPPPSHPQKMRVVGLEGEMAKDQILGPFRCIPHWKTIWMSYKIAFFFWQFRMHIIAKGKAWICWMMFWSGNANKVFKMSNIATLLHLSITFGRKPSLILLPLFWNEKKGKKIDRYVH